MSHVNQTKSSVTAPQIASRKQAGKKISMVTCYDSSFCKIINQTSIDIILVGDSLGNVMLGHNSTIPVTLDDMIHHSAAVSRVANGPLVVVDMPFMTYATVETALLNGTMLIQQGGASALKLEGGETIVPIVKQLVSCGIPVMGHLGLTPQSFHQIGGYRLQGNDIASADKMVSDALELEKCGVFALVLEMVPQDLARRITEALKIPTIGIGAGKNCDGQVLVLQDLLGFDEDFSPKFLKRYANFGQLAKNALNSFDSEVKEGVFPGPEHSFGR